MKREPDCYRNLYVTCDPSENKFVSWPGRRVYVTKYGAKHGANIVSLPRIAVIRVYMKNNR